MIIQHNLSAMNANRQMGINNSATSKSMEKLSSGYRINRSADDAAGLSISEKMRSQIRGLNQAVKNSQNGISLIQTAEGALNETHSILQRMRELTDNAANGVETSVDRNYIQDEIGQLLSEIDRIGNTTEFNTKKLLNGNLNGVSFAGDESVKITGGVVVAGIGASVSGGVDVRNAAKASIALGADLITIDGKEVVIEWSKYVEDKDIFSAPTRDQMDVARVIQDAFNKALTDKGIDASVRIQATTSGCLTILNDKKGTGSTLIISAFNGDNSLLTSVGLDTGGVSGSFSTTSIAFAASDSAFMTYNGHTLKISGLGCSDAKTLNEVASGLQGALNTAISAYNAANKDPGFTKLELVEVIATEEGRLAIKGDSGGISFSNIQGLRLYGLDDESILSSGGKMTLQIGANQGQTLSFSIGDMRTGGLGIAGLDVSTQTKAAGSLDRLDTAIQKVSSQRSKMGAIQNRLEHTIDNLGTASENMQAAESRIRDTDMASEMMSYTKNNILQQAAQSMLAQANQRPQSVLQLLG